MPVSDCAICLPCQVRICSPVIADPASRTVPATGAAPAASLTATMAPSLCPRAMTREASTSGRARSHATAATASVSRSSKSLPK
jgi:hypothetical protein